MWSEYFSGKTVIITGGSTGIGAEPRKVSPALAPHDRGGRR